MPKPTSAADPVPVRVVVVTMDSHLSGAMERAGKTLKHRMPGLQLSLHAASEWGNDPAALERCHGDIAQGDIVVATMLFMEEHFLPVLPALQARRDQCDAMVCAMSAGEVMKLTRMGRFTMDGPQSGPMALLKRLKGQKSNNSHNGAGARQMKMLRRLPKLLRFIPGTAQDLRAYFLTLQYWLAGSSDNVVGMVQSLVDRYADGPRRVLRGAGRVTPPVEYPEVGVYHPHLKSRIGVAVEALPQAGPNGTVGVLVMRSYVLAGNSGHYDGVIGALEAKGLRVIPAFAAGLDARPAVEKFFMTGGRPCVDAVVSLTGFSLVGGPAYNDARAAEEMLAALDVPYLATTPVEFQTLDQWEDSHCGLLPIEATMMVALP